MVYLGACYAAGGRDDEASGAWQTSLVGVEDSPLVYALLVDALIRSGSTQRALEIVNEARALWPDDDRFLRRAGLVHMMGGRVAPGLAMLDAYLEGHPGDPQVLLLAIRTIYQVHVAGGAVQSNARDLARAQAYAEAYAQAKGPQLALVWTWIAFLEKR